MYESQSPSDKQDKSRHVAFVSSANSPYNAWVDPVRSWNLIAEAYKTAADTIVEEQVRHEYLLAPAIMYPVVLLYRMYFELRLKDLISVIGRYHDSPVNPPKTHDLLRLWHMVEEKLKAIWPNDTNIWDQTVTVIKEFAILDPQSSAFRYPTKPDGQPNDTGLYVLEPRNLKTSVDQVASVLDGASYGIEEFLNDRRQVEAEY